MWACACGHVHVASNAVDCVVVGVHLSEGLYCLVCDTLSTCASPLITHFSFDMLKTTQDEKPRALTAFAEMVNMWSMGVVITQLMPVPQADLPKAINYRTACLAADLPMTYEGFMSHTPVEIETTEATSSPPMFSTPTPKKMTLKVHNENEKDDYVRYITAITRRTQARHRVKCLLYSMQVCF